MPAITPIIMPKWGLAMTEGTVTTWHKRPGDHFAEGEDLVEIETSKIANVLEAPFTGELRRIVAEEGLGLPVGGLIAVSADASVSDAEIDAFVADFQSSFEAEDEAQATEDGVRITRLTVGGMSLRVGISGTLSGTAIPTILIHGYSGDLDGWMFNLPALAERGPVIAVELPGHGASAKALATGSLQELADAVAGLLSALDVDRCDLVGHSLGGAIAMRIALDRPALVHGLVLIAPAGLPGGSVNAGFLREVANAQSARQLRAPLGLLFADPALATREMADEMMKFKRLDGADEALALIAEHMVRGDDFAALRDRLPDLPPATVILGRSDAIVGQPDRAALPPTWTIVELEAGHMPHMERARDVNSLILEVLA